MKPEARQIDQLLHGQRVPVQAKVYGGVLAVHNAPWFTGSNRKDDNYTITHIATGAVVANVDTQKRAAAICEDLLALEDITWEALDREQAIKIQAVLSSTPRGGVSRDQILSGTLKPLYGAAARSINSPALRAADRKASRKATAAFLCAEGVVSQGIQGVLQAAFCLGNVEFRELIMARMATGKHARIMPADVPSGPVSVAHYELGLQPCKASFRALWELGTQIDAHAAVMLYHADDDPLGANYERWQKWEEKLSGMICDGWMTWSVATSQFISLTEQQQEPFIRWLGFLGSSKKGWHALGAKTFLRSEKLAELLPIRRRIKAGREAYE